MESYSFTLKRDLSWLTIGLLLAIFGGVFPDLDQSYKSLFSHRDWLTHSAIIPLIFSGILLYSGSVNAPLFPVMAMFNLGVASHLLLDYFPSWKSGGKNEKDKDFEDIVYALEWAVEGLTGKELVQQLTGTYLVHFPISGPKGRKTLDVNKTRMYFIVNALILIVMGIFLIYLYNKYVS